MIKRICFGLILVLVLAVPVGAITWCHDYALYRITKSDQDPQLKKSLFKDGTSIKELRDYLEKHGYQRFPYTQAAQDPEKAGRFLKPGDVIIIRNDHSGYVNQQGLIDHFIQVYGASGTKYNAEELPLHSSLGGKVGGLYLDETFKQFLSRPFRQRDMTVEVWRPASTPR